MKINNYEDDDYLDELDREISKYKYKTKKAKESFTLKDLLSDEQIEGLNKYKENGR